jgi:transposase-like protein
MAQFKNLKELMAKFQDEQTCRDFLVQHRWNGRPICPYCGSDKSYKIENGKRFKCGNKECRKKYSVTVGTVAEDTNIPLSTWFGAIYLISAHKKGISSVQLGKDLGVPQKTAWFLLHRIREALREKKSLLLHSHVEADETYVGGKDTNKHEGKKMHLQGKGQDKAPVIGAIEKGGKVVTEYRQWMTKRTTTDFIENHVSKDAILVTDSAANYYKIGKKYDHIVVNHSKGEYHVGPYDTNSIENYWSLLKRGIYGIYHQVSVKHLQRYCDEFAYRFNSRKVKDSDRFEVILGRLTGRLKYDELTAENKHEEETYKEPGEEV